MLYTELSNPMSNGVYARVGGVTRWRLTPP